MFDTKSNLVSLPISPFLKNSSFLTYFDKKEASVWILTNFQFVGILYKLSLITFKNTHMEKGKKLKGKLKQKINRKKRVFTAYDYFSHRCY